MMYDVYGSIYSNMLGVLVALAVAGFFLTMADLLGLISFRAEQKLPSRDQGGRGA